MLLLITLSSLSITKNNTKTSLKSKTNKPLPMASSLFIPLLSFLSLLSLSLSTTITIPLSHNNHPKTTPSKDRYHHLTSLASQSLSRARNIKNPQNATTAAPLSAQSYGGYSVPLAFGTPPQTTQFVFDTGSDVTWFPCTRKYICKNCPFPAGDHIPVFIPKLSSSARILGCLNEKCGYIHHTNASQCRECGPGTENCTEICPPYMILYGSGNTGGFGLVDTLSLPGKKILNFVVGCSVVSNRQPAGIVGFGRGPASLPAQLGLNKFSFCLLSRKFDDTPKTTSLFLDTSSRNSAQKTFNLTYTPFLQNPSIPNRHAFSVYYYLTLRKITIGKRRLKIPYQYLKPGSDGNGGTIIDSGSTFTYMMKSLFKLVVGELAAQTKGYKRATEVELATGLGLCYDVTGLDTVVLPEMTWHFKGGAEMNLPLENFFIIAGEGGTICLAMVTDDGGVASGPAMILGSFQMQNLFVEYDLGNERFGFTKQKCGM